jgi:glucose-1-phosphate cytidylyltransferase
MKVVILAGGLGTRLAEETTVRPKPMVEIGGKPILWHIMKQYASHGIDEFVICCGYKGYIIKEYFANYLLHGADVTFDLQKNTLHVHQQVAEPWTVTLVETGQGTQTGGRIARIAEHVAGETFAMTYGDAVSDVDITKLVEFHHSHGAVATVTAVNPPSRFGAIELDQDRVSRFEEKPASVDAWVNGGFFVLSPSVFDYIDSDDTVWERDSLEQLTSEGALRAFRHRGFWQPMDTIRDRNLLEDLWASGDPPWRSW